jgi:hypothetical protein
MIILIAASFLFYKASKRIRADLLVVNEVKRQQEMIGSNL